MRVDLVWWACYHAVGDVLPPHAYRNGSLLACIRLFQRSSTPARSSVLWRCASAKSLTDKDDIVIADFESDSYTPWKTTAMPLDPGLLEEPCKTRCRSMAL